MYGNVVGNALHNIQREKVLKMCIYTNMTERIYNVYIHFLYTYSSSILTMKKKNSPFFHEPTKKRFFMCGTIPKYC